MKFEHFALNVPDARAVSRWYVQHLGLTVLRKREDAPYTHFLGDETGRVFLEIYSNPAAPYPDHGAAHQLAFHAAFYSTDAVADQQRLLQAGATALLEERFPDGSVLIFVRDPWGLSVQLCQRAKPFPGF